jgi:hypothetical protein
MTGMGERTHPMRNDMLVDPDHCEGQVELLANVGRYNSGDELKLFVLDIHGGLHGGGERKGGGSFREHKMV